MKIIFCSCLLLCFAAVYGQTFGPIEFQFSPIRSEHQWLPAVCERTRGRRVRVSFDALPPITANGLTTYYFNCHLCRILDTKCKQNRDCPIREPFTRDECCGPDRVEYIIPTLHCESFRSYNCRENLWTEGSVNGPVQHSIVYQYIYRYVPSCSCKRCGARIEEVGMYEANAQIDLRDCDEYPEDPNVGIHVDTQELPRCPDA